MLAAPHDGVIVRFLIRAGLRSRARRSVRKKTDDDQLGGGY